MAATSPVSVREATLAELLRKPVGRARAICHENECRLPRSATRRDAKTFIQLLTSVDPNAGDAFGFKGPLLRPGDTFLRAHLPVPAILLECAGVQGGHGHRRGECHYLLWRWDPYLDDWRDVGQAKSVDSSWAIALRSIAIRELTVTPEAPSPISELEQRERISCFIRAELRSNSRESKRRIAGGIYEDLLSFVVKECA
jgi:hypothetical protein